MRIITKNVALLLMLIAVACGNSKVSNIEVDAEESPVDEYATLRKQNDVSHSITEDLSGKLIVIYEKDFIERITELDNPKGFQYKGKTPCIVELYTDWCKPCGYLSQLLNSMALEYQGKVIFYKLNIEKAQDVAIAFNVKEIPKILYFKPRSEIISTVGYLNRVELKNAIEQYLLNP